MTSSSEPLVSVLTPVYNTGQYLAECIESVQAQTYSNWVYTIVNNCSTDDTLAVAQRYAANDPRIRVHNNTEFLDIIANHNLAFSLIPPESKYCKVVSADDWLYPDCVTQMVRLAEAHPSIGIVSSYWISSAQVNQIGMPYPEDFVSGKEICRRCLLGGPYVFGSPTSNLYRSDLIRSVKAFYPSSSPHADTESCYEYLDRCDFGFVHQILSFERVHTGQTSERSRVMNYYVAEHLRYLTDYGPRYLTPEELRTRLRQRLKYYYLFLAKSRLRGMDSAFWEYHRRQMAAAGYPMNSFAIARAIVAIVLDKVLNPKRTIEGLLSRA